MKYKNRILLLTCFTSIGLIPFLFSFISTTKEDSNSIYSSIRLMEQSMVLSCKEYRSNRMANLNRIDQLPTKNVNFETYKEVEGKFLKAALTTEATVDVIETVKSELIKATGGYENNDPVQMYKGAGDVQHTEELMMGNTGWAIKLQTQLVKFRDDMNTLSKGKLTATFPGLNPSEDIRITDARQKQKDFATFYFKGIPMAMVMAELTQMQIEVYKAEKTFSEILFSSISINENTASATSSSVKFVPVIQPVTSTVVPGAKYEADIFLGEKSSGRQSIMVRGYMVPVDPTTQVGKISFVAQPGAYDENGISKQSFPYRISVSYKGKDTVITGKQEYYVKRPVAQVQNANNVLYVNCGNEINVQVPDINASYNPSFFCMGGSAIKGMETGKVTIVPDTGSTEVKLKISNNGNVVSTEYFKTQQIPKPTIVLLNKGKYIDERNGMDPKTFNSLTIKSMPEEGFRKRFPIDARYNVVEWQCTLIRKRRPLQSMVFTTEVADLSTIMAMAESGDRLLVEVKQMIRTNFLNKQEKVVPQNYLINIPLY